MKPKIELLKDKEITNNQGSINTSMPTTEKSCGKEGKRKQLQEGWRHGKVKERKKA